MPCGHQLRDCAVAPASPPGSCAPVLLLPAPWFLWDSAFSLTLAAARLLPWFSRFCLTLGPLMFPCPHGRTPRCPRCPRLAPVLSACLSRSLQPALVLFLGSYPVPQGVSSTGFWDHSLREQPTSTDVPGKDFLECRCHFRDSIYSLHIDSLI